MKGTLRQFALNDFQWSGFVFLCCYYRGFLCNLVMIRCFVLLEQALFTDTLHVIESATLSIYHCSHCFLSDMLPTTYRKYSTSQYAIPNVRASPL